MTNINNALKSVRYVVDINGQQVAVILSIKAWKALNSIRTQNNTPIVKTTFKTYEVPLVEPRPLNSIEFELEEINIGKDCLVS